MTKSLTSATQLTNIEQQSQEILDTTTKELKTTLESLSEKSSVADKLRLAAEIIEITALIRQKFSNGPSEVIELPLPKKLSISLDQTVPKESSEEDFLAKESKLFGILKQNICDIFPKKFTEIPKFNDALYIGDVLVIGESIFHNLKMSESKQKLEIFKQALEDKGIIITYPLGSNIGIKYINWRKRFDKNLVINVK